jgi:hypothetical protein
MPRSSWLASMIAPTSADADPVAAHVHRHPLARLVDDERLHRLGILGAEIEDLPDLDAAALRRRASGTSAKAASSCVSSVRA